MRKHVAAIGILLVCLPAIGLAKKKTETVIKYTEKDTASYVIGMEFGKSVRENLKHLPGAPYNEELMMQAFTKVMKGDTAGLWMNLEETPKFLNPYLQKQQELAIEKAKADGKAYMEANAKRTGVVQTASGLQYEVLKQGTGAKPAATDKVKVHYHGTLIDGTVFDSSVDRGEPVSFELNRVIPGWTEGVQLMNVGSKYRFVIPSDLGYGSRPAGSIPPFSTLIFEVELLDIVQPEAPKAPAAENNGAKFQFPTYQKSGK